MPTATPDTLSAINAQPPRAVEPVRDSTTLAVRIIAIAMFLLIPLQILGYGFLPPDDALRHAAKAVSGRDWNDILLLRPGTIDASPGWHAILGAIHGVTGASPRALVWFEVTSLFFLFSLTPLLLMRRVEAWIVAVLAVALFEPLLGARLVVGRPLVLSMAVVVTLCLLWPRLEAERRDTRAIGVAAALIAAATWIHGSWYLFALPIVALALAGKRRAAVRLLVATAIGVVVGALLTGHPVAFLWQSVRHGVLAFGDTEAIELVREFRPYPGTPLLVLAVGVLVVARRVWRDASARELLRDPVFVLAVIGAALGFRVARFWMDWGLPAVVVFVALEVQALMLASTQATTAARRAVTAPALGDRATRRLVSAGALSLLCFLALTADVGGRWSNTAGDPAYRVMLAPEHRSALPDPGGVLYADDMRAFYDLFFLEPRAPWRYSTGYEPGLMPPADLAVYRRALITRDISAFQPWADRLRPGDRLVVHYDKGVPPLGLEWQYIGYNVWSGRKRSSQ